MSRYTIPLALLSCLLTVTAVGGAWLDGTVDNKRVLQRTDSSERVYQLRIDGTWLLVPHGTWRRCSMFERFPFCVFSDAPA